MRGGWSDRRLYLIFLRLGVHIKTPLATIMSPALEGGPA